MTITIDLTPEFRAELVRQAATQGVEFDAYAASLIEATARLRNVPAAAGDEPQSSAPSREVVEAIETLRGFGKVHGLSLGGMTIQGLRHEARP